MAKAGSEPWVFIRGLARSSPHWGSFIDAFEKRFAGREVERLDLAGNGSEIARPSFTRIEDHLEDVRSRSRTLRESGRVSLCTISMGSMVAALWAYRYPGEIARMVLMNTSDRGHSRFYERMRPANYLTFLSMILHAKDPLERELRVLRMTSRMREPDFERLSRAHASIPQTTTLNFFRQIWAASRFRFPDPRPEAPCLFLAGEGDRLVSPVCTKRIAERWRAALALHPDAGHDLPLDAPAWVLDQIAKWESEDVSP